MAVAAPATGRSQVLLFLAGTPHLTDNNRGGHRYETDRCSFTGSASLGHVN
jgi:hypothetical protein